MSRYRMESRYWTVLLPSIMVMVLVGACRPAGAGTGDTPDTSAAHRASSGAPVEQVPSTDEQLKGRVGALGIWYTMLSTRRVSEVNLESQGAVGPFLNADLVDPETWLGYVRSVARSNSHPTDTPMTVNIVGGWTRPHSMDQRFWIGSKYVAELQINNIKIPNASSVVLTDADRANGMQWKGSVTISFIRRIRAVQFGESVGSPEAMRRWVAGYETEQLPRFTDWESESITLPLHQRGASWEHDLKPDLSWLMTIPTSALSTKGCGIVASAGRPAPCITVSGVRVPD